MNIPALIHKIATLQSQDSQKDIQVQKDLLSVNQLQLKQIQAEKVGHLKTGLGLTDPKDRLKHQAKNIEFKKLIQNLSTKVNLAFSGLRETTEARGQQIDLVKKILREIDDSQTQIQDQNHASQPISQGVMNGGQSVTEALHAQVHLKHDQEKDHRTEQQVKNQQAVQSLEGQRQSMKDQIKALDGMSFFSKLFNIIKIIVTTVVSAVTAGVGGPTTAGASSFMNTVLPKIIQKITGIILDLLGYVGTSRFRNKYDKAQTQGSNHNQLYQNMIQDMEEGRANYVRSQKSVTRIKKHLDV